MTRRDFLAAAAAVPAAPIPAAPARRSIYAWYPARFGTWNTASIRWSALTHLSFRSVVIRGDGSLATTAGKPPRDFVERAHRHGVKVTVLVWADKREDSDSYLARHGAEAARNLAAYVRGNGLDGLAFDDEQPRATNNGTGGPNAPLLGAFFERLRDALPPPLHRAYAAPPVISARDRFGASWIPWDRIVPAVDAVIPMIYTANPPSIGWSTNPEPLEGGGSTPQTVTRDIVTLMRDYLVAVPRAKLLLGINAFPFAGYEFRCRTEQRLSPTLGPGRRRPFAEMEAQARLHGARWDEAQQSAWYAFREGDAWVQGWYDTARSWRAKLAYIDRQGLGGAGIWVLDGAGDSDAMWEMI